MGGKYHAVYIAVCQNKLRALVFLVAAAGADPNLPVDKYRWSRSGKSTPCFVACCGRNFDAIRVLLVLGAQLDHNTDSNGCMCPQDIEPTPIGRGGARFRQVPAPGV